jgi:hypothetical protein
VWQVEIVFNYAAQTQCITPLKEAVKLGISILLALGFFDGSSEAHGHGNIRG